MDERIEKIEDTCMGPDCKVKMYRPVGAKRWYCSIECACYAGAYSVTKGWLPKEENVEPDSVERCPSRKPEKNKESIRERL